MICIHRKNDGRCCKKNISFCIGESCPSKQMSNADLFRTLNDEDLAEELLNWYSAFHSVEWTREKVLEWLKGPAEENR